MRTTRKHRRKITHQLPLHYYQFDDPTTFCGIPLRAMARGGISIFRRLVTCKRCRRSLR